MKLLFVSHNATLTGAPKVIFQIAKEFSKQHDVTLVTKEDGPLFQEMLRDPANTIVGHNTDTAYGNYDFSFEEKVEMARLFLEKEMPEVVYANSVETAEWLIAARMLKISNIFHMHEMKDALYSGLRTGCVSLDVMDYVDLLINVSKDVERDVKAFFPTRPKRSVILENFFECDDIVARAQKKQPLPKNANGQRLNPDKLTICGCGSASPRKGVDIFFEVAKVLPDIQFLWIGRFHNQSGNPLKQTFFDDALPNFFITDEVENPYFYLNLAEMMILTSREDPNPLVVFEALILGKQVVCFTKTGGSRFVLDRWGYTLSNESNCDSIVEFLNKVIIKEAGGTRLYEPSWLASIPERVREHYDLSSIFPTFERLVRETRNGQLVANLSPDAADLEVATLDTSGRDATLALTPKEAQSSGVVIKAIRPLQYPTDTLKADYIDFPLVGQFYLESGIQLAGWVTGRNADPKSVEIVVDGHCVQTVPVTFHRKKIGRNVGFNENIHIPTFHDKQIVELVASFEEGQRVPFAQLHLIAQPTSTVLNRGLGPDFIIGGAMKAATTAIYDYLVQHPQVMERHPKEVHFFSEAFPKGFDWYQSLFAVFKEGTLVTDQLSGEASPGYLPSVKAPIRLKALFPESKIIFSLRDPVERAISQYYHSCAWKLGETRSIEQAFDQAAIAQATEEISALEKSNTVPVEQGSDDTTWYLFNGHYATFLKRWFRAFPKEQILLLNYHRFAQFPEELPSKLLPFLGLPNSQEMERKQMFSNDYSGVPDSVIDNLKAYYEPHNKALNDFLGFDIWSMD
ncbi:MAG: sulfotransferase [Phormidesmis sp.]